MEPINDFILEPLAEHPDQIHSWLWMNGKRTSTWLKGLSLLHQFRFADGYLLISDFDCPFEEVTVFTLLDLRLRKVCSRSIGAMYSSFLLSGIEWRSPCHALLDFGGGDYWELNIRRFHVPLLWPRLQVRPCGDQTV
ncbi:hypothetical protein ACFFU8_14975 [Chromobacterium piscinae]|uniref:hypothetical protein n=1 Tax=Chromobacterium piscinae TaxID=686831 RepID=UPI00140829D1|nr:hypothetical protein [Chromobacterium piscinae]MBX9295921.1 hypothetical protein [Chromobacterium vaccinii]MBX9356696.1 hypothetical protein [Chromobacterium vaccinii]MCD4502722.1 hypothetical protein [Chromobacterium piscinae]MCD5328600.1 hypothetical protein [Chromobacterium piscinae]NHQ80905.1 hypothetical protein [Chromobacterium vaccinii]